MRFYPQGMLEWYPLFDITAHKAVLTPSKIDFARHDGRAAMTAFATPRAAFQSFQRQIAASLTHFLHEEDGIRFDYPITTCAGDAQVVAAPSAVVDRIELLPRHPAIGTFEERTASGSSEKNCRR